MDLTKQIGPLNQLGIPLGKDHEKFRALVFDELEVPAIRPVRQHGRRNQSFEIDDPPAGDGPCGRAYG